MLYGSCPGLPRPCIFILTPFFPFWLPNQCSGGQGALTGDSWPTDLAVQCKDSRMWYCLCSPMLETPGYWVMLRDDDAWRPHGLRIKPCWACALIVHFLLAPPFYIGPSAVLPVGASVPFWVVNSQPLKPFFKGHDHRSSEFTPDSALRNHF